MKIKYLGTAASEAIPALFCECPVCEKARKALDKDLRCRSGMVIDDTILVDFPPDIYFSSIRLGVYLPAVRDIVITHTHGDHFDAEELLYRDSRAFCTLKENIPVHLYGNEQVWTEFKYNIDHLWYKNLPDVEYSQVYAFTPFQVQDYTVTPLPANHKPDEQAFIYMIEKDNDVLLYGNDTGTFPAETKAYIERIKPHFTLVSLDCTMGFISIPHSHMGFEQIVDTRKWLLDLGCADSKTTFIATHFSHNGMLKDGKPYMHADLEEMLNPEGFRVAYDGLEIK